MKINCSVCSGLVDKDDHAEVPLMYNLGEGPRYVGACCYPTFVFNVVMVQAEGRKWANRRAAHERAKRS